MIGRCQSLGLAMNPNETLKYILLFLCHGGNNLNDQDVNREMQNVPKAICLLLRAERFVRNRGTKACPKIGIIREAEINYNTLSSRKPTWPNSQKLGLGIGLFRNPSLWGSF